MPRNKRIWKMQFTQSECGRETNKENVFSEEKKNTRRAKNNINKISNKKKKQIQRKQLHWMRTMKQCDNNNTIKLLERLERLCFTIFQFYDFCVWYLCCCLVVVLLQKYMVTRIREFTVQRSLHCVARSSTSQSTRRGSLHVPGKLFQIYSMRPFRSMCFIIFLNYARCWAVDKQMSSINHESN